MGWCNGLADPGAFGFGLWGFGFGDWRLELLPERRGHRVFVRTCSAGVVVLSSLALHRALRRMAGLIFLLVFWALAGACQRHDMGRFIVQFIIIMVLSSARPAICHLPSAYCGANSDSDAGS